MGRDVEHKIQTSLMREFSARRVPGGVGFAVPNGGWRTKATAWRMRAEGVVAGVPDLWFGAPGVQPLWIELKRDWPTRGRLSREQSTMFEAMRGAGARVDVAYGLDEAIDILERAGIIDPDAGWLLRR